MTLRFRKMDVFAIVGLVVLVAWAPAYWAQSEDERAQAGTFSFHVPGPRDGDRAVFALTVQIGEEAPRRVDEFLRIERRLVTPGEVPVAAHWVEEATWSDDHLRLGAATFEQTAGYRHTYYDARGVPVWERSSSVEGRLRGEDGTWYRATVERSGAHSGHVGEQAQDFGRQVTYEPDRLSLVWLNVEKDMRYAAWELGLAPARPSDVFGDLVVALDGEPFYATDDNVYERILPGASGDNGGGGDLHLEDILFGGADGLIEFDERGPYAVGQVSRLYHPGWAGQAGVLERRVDQDGREQLLEWVVALSDWSRGAGAALPVAAVREEPGSMHPYPVARDPTRQDDRLGHQNLRDLTDDERPVVRDVAIADLARALQNGSAPEPVRAVAAAGVVVGLAWDLEPPQAVDRTEEVPAPLPPPLGQETTRVTQVSSWVSRFVVAMSGPAGETTVAEVVVNDTSDGERTVHVRALCGATYAWADERFPVTCAQQPRDLVDVQRAVVPPQVFLDRIEPDGASHAPDAFVWSAADRFIADDYGHPHGEGPLGLDPFELGYPRSLLPDRAGVVAWRDRTFDDAGGPLTQTGGAWHPGDARLLSWHHMERHDAHEDPAPAPAPSAVSIVRMEPVPTAIATVGLLLVAASLVTRLGAALAAGAHYPVLATMYARVSKGAALVHERRQEIVDLLQADGGLTASEVARRLGYSYNATVHHLETLRRTDHLVHVQDGRRRRYFVPARRAQKELRREAVLRDPEKARFLSVVQRTPGLSLQEVVRLVPQGLWGASRTGSALADAGLVEKRRDGKAVRFYPAEMDEGRAEAQEG